MPKAIVNRICVMSVMAAVAIGAMPAGATDRAAERATTAQVAQAGCRMYGPYATMRRANEVANQASSSGYSAVPFHNGDGYYVRVC